MAHLTQKEFDEFYTMQKGKLTYPSVCIEKPTDELVVLLSGMEEGSLPVIIHHNRKLVEVARIKKTPKSLKRLLIIYELTLLVNPEVTHRAKTMTELLDIGDLSWTD